MRLVFGLGNIGEEYENTRHNVGFEVVDLLAKRLGVEWKPWKTAGRRTTLASIARGGAGGKEKGFALFKPWTFMNRSGEAVLAATKWFGAEPEAESEPVSETAPPDFSNVMLVSDDWALPVGALRIRKKGSSGGQKGLDSVIASLATQDFPRLRVGIGESRGDPSQFVLSRFNRADREKVEQVFERAAEALELWLQSGDLDRCMNRYNPAPE